MRKQYHFRPTKTGVLIWDVDRLVRLSADFPRRYVRLDTIREIDEVYWYGSEGDKPTCRSIMEHARLINETDLRYPIILSADGGVMDGMHRVLKAVMEGRETIEAVKFEQDPEPDFKDKHPDDLPY